MSVQSIAAPGPSRDAQWQKRNFRWRFFQVVFGLTYLGIVLDEVTTALGFQRDGQQYEQNPLGGAMIGHLGWLGLLLLMTVLCWICYVSFRTVYWRLSTRWSAILNVVVVLVMLVRWLAVVTAIMYLKGA